MPPRRSSCALGTHILFPKSPDRAPQLAQDVLARRFANLEHDTFDSLGRRRGRGGGRRSGGRVGRRRGGGIRVEAERDARLVHAVGIQLFGAGVRSLSVSPPSVRRERHPRCPDTPRRQLVVSLRTGLTRDSARYCRRRAGAARPDRSEFGSKPEEGSRRSCAAVSSLFCVGNQHSRTPARERDERRREARGVTGDVGHEPERVGVTPNTTPG